MLVYSNATNTLLSVCKFICETYVLVVYSNTEIGFAKNRHRSCVYT